MGIPESSAARRRILDTALAFIFLSLVTGFIEAIYAVGLLGVEIPPEALFALCFLSPLVLIAFPRLMDAPALVLLAGVFAVAAWAIGLPLGPRGRMAADGAGLGLFLLFIAANSRRTRRDPEEWGMSLCLAVLLSAALRALRSGNLVFERGPLLPIGILIAAAALSLLVLEGFRPGRAEDYPFAAGKGSPWRVIAASLGLSSAFALAYLCFSSPAALSRWGEASYPVVLLAELGAILHFLALPAFRKPIGKWILLGWNAAFAIALFLAFFPRQPAFGSAAAFPLWAPGPKPWADVAFWAMLVLHPVAYADISLLLGAVREEGPSPRMSALSVLSGSLWLLVLILSQILTTIYDYVPAIGPLFRNASAAVMALPAAVLALSVLLLVAIPKRGRPSSRMVPASLPDSKAVWLAGAVGIAALALAAAGIIGAKPAVPGRKASLRVLSYNVQQGYGKDGRRRMDEQIELIRKMRPDVIGLGETDSARAANGNSDLVRYFADRLGMHSYYGPSPESGTFGIAMLSRFPIGEPRVFYMASSGEQTATIEALLRAGGKDFRVFVTHLGNDGDMVQQLAILDRIEADASDNEFAVLMGDFNFDPRSEQYRATDATLDDAFALSEGHVVEPGAPPMGKRVDHIFVRPGARVIESALLGAGASDHPAVFAEIDCR
jgi:endonuclease/exonuclease/phosphatase family metal-dependent hydrolase